MKYDEDLYQKKEEELLKQKKVEEREKYIQKFNEYILDKK